MLGVPVLIGSCAYAIAEGAAWRGSLDRKPSGAKKFYAIMAAAMLLGLALNFAELNPIRMRFLSGGPNGGLGPPPSLLAPLLANGPPRNGPLGNPPALA